MSGLLDSGDPWDQVPPVLLSPLTPLIIIMTGLQLLRLITDDDHGRGLVVTVRTLATK